MNQKKILLIFALAFALLLGGAGFLYRDLSQKVENDQLAAQSQTGEGAESASAGEEEIPPAPDFTVYDLEGNELVMNPGQTWVCTILDNDMEDTVIK